VLNGKRFALTTPTPAGDGGARQRSRIIVTLIPLFGFSLCASSEPLLITSGRWNLVPPGHWEFIGDGFSAFGDNDFTDIIHCGFCLAPFQLRNPVPLPSSAAFGVLTLGEKSYTFPNLETPLHPWARGFVFLTPQDTLPTITEAGTYDVPFNVGGSFCVTDDPHVVPPFPPDPGNPSCFSVLGAAIAHYTVFAGNGGFFQPAPTIEIVPVPEPGTVGAGMLAIVLMLAAKYRTKVVLTLDA